MAILNRPIERLGPLLDVAVSVSEDVAGRRRANRLPVVMPHVCPALVDTGASRSLIDLTVVAALGLESVGEMALATASTGRERKSSPAFVVRITITVGGRSLVTPVTAVESDLSEFGVGVLIGRDILARCLLVYNGPSGQFSLAF